MNVAQIAALVSSPPFGPANVIATPVSANQINLKWNAAAGAVDYNVQRSIISGGPYTTIATGLTATNYLNSNLNANVTYYYVIGSVNTNGGKLNSAQVAITTPAGTAAPTGQTRKASP